MSEAKQFLVAGCWGNLNDVGNLKNVLLTLHENIKPKTKQEILILGDNYYREKSKEKKVTTLNLLTAAFDMLKASAGNTPIKMIAGNHDLEKQTIVVDDHGELDTDSCVITKNERSRSEFDDIDLKLWHKVHVADGICIVMIDSNAYLKKKDLDKLEPCYKHFDESRTKTADQVRKDHEQNVMDAIDETIADNNGTITNFVLCMHHPVLCLKKNKPEKHVPDKKEEKKSKKDEVEEKKDEGDKKSKKDEKKSKKDEGEEKKDEGDKKSKKGLLFELNSDIFNMYPFLSKIHEKINNANAKFIVLCADYHLYQHGIIDINDGTNKFEIEQYIVGTGGTDLDPEIPRDPTSGKVILSANCIDISNENGAEQFATQIHYDFGGDKTSVEAPTENDTPPVSYVLSEYTRKHGILSCILHKTKSSKISFDFIEAPIKVGGGGKNTTKHLYKIKRRKTKRRYPKTR